MEKVHFKRIHLQVEVLFIGGNPGAVDDHSAPLSKADSVGL